MESGAVAQHPTYKSIKVTRYLVKPGDINWCEIVQIKMMD